MLESGIIDAYFTLRRYPERFGASPGSKIVDHSVVVSIRLFRKISVLATPESTMLSTLDGRRSD